MTLALLPKKNMDCKPWLKVSTKLAHFLLSKECYFSLLTHRIFLKHLTSEKQPMLLAPKEKLSKMMRKNLAKLCFTLESRDRLSTQTTSIGNEMLNFSNV